MTNGGRFVPGPKVLCACEDFESEAADEETAIFREYLKHLETMLKLTLCVCGHSQENHSRDDNINNPDPGEPCSKCDCFTFRPTFYRDGEK